MLFLYSAEPKRRVLGVARMVSGVASAFSAALFQVGNRLWECQTSCICELHPGSVMGSEERSWITGTPRGPGQQRGLMPPKVRHLLALEATLSRDPHSFPVQGAWPCAVTPRGCREGPGEDTGLPSLGGGQRGISQPMSPTFPLQTAVPRSCAATSGGAQRRASRWR